MQVQLVFGAVRPLASEGEALALGPHRFHLHLGQRLILWLIHGNLRTQ